MGHESKGGRIPSGEPAERGGLTQGIRRGVRERMPGHNRVLAGQETAGLGRFGQSVRELIQRPFSRREGARERNEAGQPPQEPPRRGRGGAGEAPDPRKFHQTNMYAGETFRDLVGSDSPTYHTVPPVRESTIAEDPATAIERGEAELIFTQVDAAVRDLGLDTVLSGEPAVKGELDLSRGIRARFVDGDNAELMVSTLFGNPEPYSVHTFVQPQGQSETGEPNRWIHSQNEGLRISGADERPPQTPTGDAYTGVTQRLQSVVAATEAVYIDLPRSSK